MYLENKQITETWQSPDGKVTIYTFVDQNGTERKTMSKTVGTFGFKGEVEEYTNAKGNAYVKQPQKEGGFAGGSAKDSEGMAWGNALTNATTLVVASKAGKEFELTIAVGAVLETAQKLLQGRGSQDVPATKPAPSPQAPLPDVSEKDYSGEPFNPSDYGL